MLRTGPCFVPVNPWLGWLAAGQVARGIWFGLHPVRRSPNWYGKGVARLPAGTADWAKAPVAVVTEPVRPGAPTGPGADAVPIGPGIPYGLGLGTTPGVPGAAISPLIGQAGPFEPRQALRWLATHYLPQTTLSQPLGPIFGSGIGLPGMPISAAEGRGEIGAEPVRGR